MTSTMTQDQEGNKTWCNQQNQRHRTLGPAVEYADGGKSWYLNGQLHRTDGPAIEHVSGYKAWWVDGQRHRTDGPAIERADGTKVWWVDDQELTFDEWVDRVADTDQERTLLMIKFS